MTKEQIERLKYLNSKLTDMFRGSAADPFNQSVYSELVKGLLEHAEWLLDCACVED